MVGYGLSHEIPKCPGVAELRQMAQFVDNNIIREQRWQEYNFIIKIEIPFARTAPPQRPLIFDTDFIKPQSVHPVKIRDTITRKRKSAFFVLEKIPLRASGYDSRR